MSYSRAADVHSFAHAVALGAGQTTGAWPARGTAPRPRAGHAGPGAEPRIPPRPADPPRPALPAAPASGPTIPSPSGKPARPAASELSELVRLIAVVAENWCRHT